MARRRNGEPGKHGVEEARDRILAAASEEFSMEGFAGARVDRIAQRAAVNKAMLYYYVGDKEALYEAVLINNFTLLTEAMQSAKADSRGAEDQLRSVLSALVRTLHRIPDHPRLMVRELAAGAAHLPVPVVEQMARVFSIVRSILDEGRKEGVFRDVDPLLTHLAIVGSTVFLIASGPIRQRFNEALGATDQPAPGEEALAEQIADLILGGIKRKET